MLNEAKTNLIQTILNARLYIQPSNATILGSDEDLRPPEPTLPDRLTRFGFVVIGLGRIYGK